MDQSTPAPRVRVPPVSVSPPASSPSHSPRQGVGKWKAGEVSSPGSSPRPAGSPRAKPLPSTPHQEEKIKAKPLPLAGGGGEEMGPSLRARSSSKDDLGGESSSEELSPRSVGGPKSPRGLPKMPEKTHKRSESQASPVIPPKLPKSPRTGVFWKAAERTAGSGVGGSEKSAPGARAQWKFSSTKNAGGELNNWRSSLTVTSTAPLIDAPSSADSLGTGDSADDDEVNVEPFDGSKTTSDQVYTWGLRGIANGKTPLPVLLSELGWGETVTKVACGAGHFILVTSLRRCYTWGKGSNGQLGHGAALSVSAPLLVQALNGVYVEMAHAGGDQTVVWTADRECYYFGWADKPGAEKPQLVPTPVPKLKGLYLKSIAVGYHHVLVCTRAGDLWGWGSNGCGELGASAITEEFVPAPVEVDAVKKVIFVAAGEDCSACITNMGYVFYWGSAAIRSKSNQVGSKPTQIKFPRPCSALALGARHMVALGRLGEVWTVGHGENGQLGCGKMHFMADPCAISFEDATEPGVDHGGASTSGSTSTGGGSSSLISNPGSPFFAGSPKGSVDIGPTVSGGTYSGPSSVSEKDDKKKPGLFQRMFNKEGVIVPMASISAGQGFAAAVSLEGKVYFWGTDPGTKNVHALPILLPELRSICVGSLACGSFACAITVDMQNTSDLIFHSYNPPILRAATLTSAFDFLFGSKGTKAPLLDFVMHTIWPTFCDETELLSALNWTWTSLVEMESRQRMSSFVTAFVQENMTRITSNLVFGTQLRDWLVQTGQDAALKVFHALPNIQTALNLGPSEDGPPPTKVDLLAYSPETCAEQLTLIDHRLLVPIMPLELLERGWTKKEKEVMSPNVMAVISRFNLMADFVRCDIVMGKDVPTRSRRMRFWVDVQKQCFNLNNFNSVMALSAALASVAVRKLLKHDLMDLSRNHRRWMDFVEEEFRSRNMKGYRTKVVAALKDHEPSIPFLATHLKDLIFIHDGNPDTLDGGLVNMYKRYLLARQVFQIRKMQETTYSALKKVDDLYRHLLNMTVEWDERKCDEMVERYHEEAAAFAAPLAASPISASDGSVDPPQHWVAAGPTAESGRSFLASSAKAVLTPPTSSATPQSAPLESFSMILSPDNPERLRLEGEADPEGRLTCWQGWVQQYISKKEEFALAWSRSQALEGLVRVALMYPLTKDEEPVLETLFSYFLIKGVDIRHLLDFLRTAASVDPERDAREWIVALFCSLKVNSTHLFSPSALPDIPSITDAPTDESAFAILESSCKVFLTGDRGPAAAYRQLAALLRSQVIVAQLREAVQGPLAGQKRQLQDLLSQRDLGKQERAQALLTADKLIGDTQRKLKEIQDREAALRAQLEAVVAERNLLEQKLLNAQGALDTTCRQQNQRIDILTANIDHHDHEMQSRTKVLTALETVSENVVASQPVWASLAAQWMIPLDARLALLDEYFGRLEERLQQLSVKLRVNNGTADAPMWITLDKVRSLFERAQTGPYASLLSQVESLPSSQVASRQKILARLASSARKIEATCQDLHKKFNAGAK